MKEIDLEKYRLSWNRENSFGGEPLSGPELSEYLKRRSGGMTSAFRTWLFFDITVKSFLGLSFVVLLGLYHGNTITAVVCGVLALLTGYLVIMQVRTLGKIPGQEAYTSDIRNFLEKNISFLTASFTRSLHVNALNNPLLIASGLLFYILVKYEGARPMDLPDIMVFSLIAVVSYVIGFILQDRQFKFQIRQMEECLKELDEGELSVQRIKDHARQRRLILLLFIVILALGLAVMGYILTL